MEDDISASSSHRKRQCRSPANLLINIVDEITCIVNGKLTLPTHKTLFFKLVRGGNVDIIRQVLQYLYWHSMHSEITWAIGRQPYLTPKKSEDLTVPTGVHRHAKIASFVLLFVAFIVTSPIFYGIHAIMYHLEMQRHKSWESKDLQLPLLYALLSEESEMAELFLEFGCSVTEQDSDGNNVYHHLAALSADDSQKAVRCHQILKLVCCDELTLRYVVTEQQNRLQYTAWEYTAKYGSLYLCCLLANDGCGFGKLVLGVSPTHLWAREPEQQLPEKGEDCDEEPDERDAKQVGDFNVWEYDISRYETGDKKQSYPLQLFASRAVEKLPESDISALLTSKFVVAWMSKKIKKFLLPSILSHLLGIVITLLFLNYIIWHGGDMDVTPLYDASWVSKTYRNELDKLTAAARGNNTIPTYNSMIYQYNTNANSVNSCMFNLHRHTVENGVIILIDDCHYQLVLDWKRRCADQCECNLSLDNIIVHLLISSHTDRITSLTQYIVHVLIGVYLLQDIICRLAFLVKNFNWSGLSIHDVIMPVLCGRIPGSYLEKTLNIAMFHLYIAGVVLSRYLHESVIKRVGEHSEEGWRLSHINSMKTKTSLEDHLLELIRLMQQKEFLDAVISKLIIICLLLRFIQAILTLRLIPSIGFFVITAKKMAKHLLEFTMVFVIVLLAFGTIFYFIMRQPECPAMKIKEFQSLMSSVFSAYQVSLGYGEFDFSIHLNAKLAYIAFTVMSTMLLLNLIIAVMTTTVDDMNQSPWKEALNSLELWDEILGIEVVILILTRPARWLRSLCQCQSSSEKEKTTFEVVHWSRGNYFG